MFMPQTNAMFRIKECYWKALCPIRLHRYKCALLRKWLLIVAEIGNEGCSFGSKRALLDLYDMHLQCMIGQQDCMPRIQRTWHTDFRNST